MVALNYTKTLCLVIIGISMALILSTCSISDSAGSLSDSGGSLANSSESISDSSTSSSDYSKPSTDSNHNRYESEVKDFTVTYLRTNSSHTDQNSFMKGISDVASHNGIVDWEANPKTYRGIGKGLKKAKVSGSQYQMYKKKFADNDRGKMEDIQEGYEN